MDTGYSSVQTTGNKEVVIYEFGPFQLDTSKQALFLDGGRVHLSRQAYRILLVLLNSSRQVVKKEELMRRVWENSIVEEINLAVHISKLRKALGEDAARPRYILTVPRHGYVFNGEVKESPERYEGPASDKGGKLLDLDEVPIRGGKPVLIGLTSLPRRLLKKAWYQRKDRLSVIIVCVILVLALLWLASKILPRHF